MSWLYQDRKMIEEFVPRVFFTEVETLLFEQRVRGEKSQKVSQAVYITDYMKKRIKRRIQLFSSLPPRVIIFILSYCEVELEVCEEEDEIDDGRFMFNYCGPTKKILAKKDFDLFGCFKLAKVRNIWFLFPSLQIDGNTKVIVDFSRVRNLNINVKRRKSTIIETILRESTSLYLLEKLKVTKLEREIIDQCKSELTEKSFPSLKSLEISKMKTLLPGLEKCHFWGKLRHLTLSSTNHLTSPNRNATSIESLTRLEDQLVKLENVFIQNCSFRTETVFSVPNVRELILLKCKNIVFVPSVKIKKLILRLVDSQCVKKIYEKIPHHCGIEEIHFLEIFSESSDGALDNQMNWLFGHYNLMKNEEMFPSLKEVTLFDIKSFVGSSLSSFGKSTSSIVLSDLPKLSGNILFRNEYPNLRNLILDKLPSLFDCDSFPSFFSEIIELQIKKCQSITSRFFCGDFKNLTTLILENLHSLRGNIGWGEMNSLKCVIFQNISNLDSIFSNLHISFFDNVFQMILRKNEDLTGEGWGNRIFKKLERFKISLCDQAGDEIFQQNEFSSLKFLRINDNFETTGKDWKPMKKLISLFIHDCRVFDDSFFQQNESDDLECLQLTGSNCCEGEGWKMMSKLRSLSVYDNHFPLSFFKENKPFRENCHVRKLIFCGVGW